MSGNVSPKSAVIFLMNGAAPERKDEIASLWARYPADVILVPDAKRVTLNANKDRIAFDAKTMDVFWLIGLAGWKAIECYALERVLREDVVLYSACDVFFDRPNWLISCGG